MLASSRSRLSRATWVRRVMTGLRRRAPISTAFCAMSSSLACFSGANRRIDVGRHVLIPGSRGDGERRILRRRSERRGEFAVAPVEDQHAGACGQAQHVEEIVRLLGSRADGARPRRAAPRRGGGGVEIGAAMRAFEGWTDDRGSAVRPFAAEPAYGTAEANGATVTMARAKRTSLRAGASASLPETRPMTLWAKLGVAFAALAILAALPSKAFAADAAHPAVIELFQSQGCSSCPPAAANVMAISGRADVLALAFEVDYWDRLGWKDTFSKPAWTARQYSYARAMGRDGVYTPQVVVNGRVEGDRSRTGRARWARQPGRSRPGRAGDPFRGRDGRGRRGRVAAGGAEVWLARYDPRIVEVAVRRGENAGRTLPHKDVVHEMILLGRWHGPAETSRFLRAERRACRMR